MPNWVEGNFRARGKKKDLLKFILEGFEYAGLDESKTYAPTLNEYEDEMGVEFGGYMTLWVKDTHRNFVEGDSVWMYTSHLKKGEYQIILPYRAAWSINSEAIGNIAAKYNIDIKVNGYEAGMCFSQVIEAERDGMVTEDSTDYNDWLWECDMPMMGG